MTALGNSLMCNIHHRILIGMAVCDTRECEGIGITGRTGRCAFCGSSRKLNSSWGGPTMPLFLECCDDCRDRKVPDRGGALGQARMF